MIREYSFKVSLIVLCLVLVSCSSEPEVTNNVETPFTIIHGLNYSYTFRDDGSVKIKDRFGRQTINGFAWRGKVGSNNLFYTNLNFTWNYTIWTGKMQQLRRIIQQR